MNSMSLPCQGRPETSACRILLTCASHFTAIRKLITLSGHELAFTAHPLPSYSCRLNNRECSSQNTTPSPQLCSWSAYSGLWLPFSLLFSWKPSKHSSPFSSASIRIICSALVKSRDLQSWFRRTHSARNTVIHSENQCQLLCLHTVWFG